jgi:hypothetical protein
MVNHILDTQASLNKTLSFTIDHVLPVYHGNVTKRAFWGSGRESNDSVAVPVLSRLGAFVYLGSGASESKRKSFGKAGDMSNM